MTVARLEDARVPACLVEADLPPGGDGLVRADILLEGGRIADLVPPGATGQGDGPAIALDGGIVWSAPVDLHTHLDKGHIWPRRENPDGTFMGALRAVAADREAHWSAEDVAARFEFGLRCAEAHGTRAIRTHIDSQGDQAGISWPVFARLRDAWAGRIALQAVSLEAIDKFQGDAVVAVADTVADHGGILGAVTFPTPGVEALIDRVFALAEERGLSLDFHVDETGDPGSRTLGMIAETAIRRGFDRGIVVGHCCSMATLPDDEAAAILDRVAGAGITVVTLPMCNLYLQDRVPGRTPRWRGVTLVHEMAARGIPVAAASDNCRDPFYGYGDHDAVEVYREVTRIAHLDRPVGDWPALVTRTPARAMGLDWDGVLRPGAPADLVAFRARAWHELLSRPQADRRVLRAGHGIDTTLPDYRELDAVVGGP
ncbi:MAG: cytosine deaminase [Azospirillaceae bacterium]